MSAVSTAAWRVVAHVYVVCVCLRVHVRDRERALWCVCLCVCLSQVLNTSSTETPVSTCRSALLTPGSHGAKGKRRLCMSTDGQGLRVHAEPESSGSQQTEAGVTTGLETKETKRISISTNSVQTFPLLVCSHE